AGLQLQFNPRIKVRTVFGEGELTQIGMLVSRLRCAGIVYQVRNRHIHKAFLDGAEIAASHLVNTTAGGTESPT
ncbi:MAG: hypothetical protein KDA78_13140, partial [Planctomycetaceae bacterium]|nr:hypothetical protein [Planctomycetaceae bacterium]